MVKESLDDIHAIIFDLDDTLYDKAEWLIPAIEAAAKARQMDGELAIRLAMDYISKRGCADAGIYNHILLGMGQSDSVLNIKAFLDRMNEHRSAPGGLQLHPGVYEALLQMRECYRLAVVATGLKDIQQSKIAALGLKGLVHSTIIVESERDKQRTPALTTALTIAINKLGTRAGSALFVADNPFKDFITARSLGLKTTRVLTGEYSAFDYPSPQHVADYDISSVARLPELLEMEEPIPNRAQVAKETSIQSLINMAEVLESGSSMLDLSK